MVSKLKTQGEAERGKVGLPGVGFLGKRDDGRALGLTLPLAPGHRYIILHMEEEWQDGRMDGSDTGAREEWQDGRKGVTCIHVSGVTEWEEE